MLEKEFQDRFINILGSTYSIIFIHTPKQAKYYPIIDPLTDGVCNSDCKLILIKAFDSSENKITCNDELYLNNIREYIKRCLRHEIIHAYFNECGLRSQCNVSNQPWSRNESMVDWWAIMSPKIFTTFKILNLVD